MTMKTFFMLVVLFLLSQLYVFAQPRDWKEL